MTPPNPPEIPDALVGQIITRAAQDLQANRLDQAESACRDALRLQPTTAVALQLLGLIAHRRENYATAVKHLQASIEIDNTQAPWHFNLGVSCRAANQLTQAQHAYTAAIACNPDYAAAHYNLGSVFLEQGDTESAFRSFQNTTRIDPNHANAHFQLGSLHRTRGDIGKSVRSFRKAHTLAPDDQEIQLCLAVSLTEFDGLNEAKTILEPLCQARPGWADAGSALAAVYERLGDTDLAWKHLAPALSQDPVPVDAALALANLAPKLDRIDQAITILQNILHIDPPDPSPRMLCHFALGRLFDRLEESDQAFDHFTKANQLKPCAYTPDEHQHFIDAMIQTFGGADPQHDSPTRPDGPRPIFIVGMPRSGTSLVEQVFASHPQITGGGELPLISALTQQVSRATDSDQPYPHSIPALTGPHLQEMANLYHAKLLEISPNAEYVTDKAPTNFLHLGLISRILPHAKIIHCQRTPAAACWSCYTQNFVGTHPYSYDLAHLAHYHRQYQRLTHHWQDTLPTPTLDVVYEDLVTDPEPQMRQLIDFVGLDWNADCLRFHENTRPMPSASYDQVRQPIYTSAIDRWRRYEQHLKPLCDALDRPAA